MDVAVHKTYEMDQMNHHVSFIDKDGQALEYAGSGTVSCELATTYLTCDI